MLAKAIAFAYDHLVTALCGAVSVHNTGENERQVERCAVVKGEEENDKTKGNGCDLSFKSSCRAILGTRLN